MKKPLRNQFKIQLNNEIDFGTSIQQKNNTTSKLLAWLRGKPPDGVRREKSCKDPTNFCTMVPAYILAEEELRISNVGTMALQLWHSEHNFFY